MSNDEYQQQQYWPKPKLSLIEQLKAYSLAYDIITYRLECMLNEERIKQGTNGKTSLPRG